MTARVIIEGVVQGVGFRQFIASHAIRLGLTGWVINRPDGAVEALFTGEKNNIETVIQLCRKGTFAAEIDAVSVDWEKGEIPSEGFTIKKEA